MTAIPWLLTAIFAIACVYLWLVADTEKQRNGWLRDRLDRQEKEIRYWRDAALGPRLVWPEQVRNVWARIGPN